MEFAVFWFLLSIIVGVAAGRRGRSSGGWALLALLISPLLAGLLLLAVGGKPAEPDQIVVGGETATPATHVRCPDCRELVRRDARRCKHCGTGLVPQ